MQGYIYLVIAVLCYSFQNIFVRSYQKQVDETMEGTATFMFLSGAFGILFLLIVNTITSGGVKFGFSLIPFFLAVIYGIAYSSCALAGFKAMRTGKTSIYNMFSNLGGVFLPFLFGIFWLNEGLTVMKVIAMLLFCGTLLPDLLASRGGNKAALVFFVMCMISLITNGSTGILVKIHTMSEKPLSEAMFLIYGMIVMTLVAVVILAFKKVTPKKALSIIPKRGGWLVLIYTSLNNLGSIFSLKAALTVPASIEYPIINGGCIFVSTILYMLVFRERPTKINFACIAMSLASVILINI